MKNLTFVFLALMVLIVPTVIAESGPGSDGSDDDVRSVLAARADFRDRLQNIRDFDDCMEKGLKEFPSVDREDIRRFCLEIAKDDDSDSSGKIVAAKTILAAYEYREKIRTESGDDKAEYEIRLKAVDRLVDIDPALADKLASLRAELIEKYSNLPRAKQEELADLTGQGLADRLERIRIEIRSEDDITKKRIVTELKLRTANDAYDGAKNRYEEHARKYDEAKDDFDALKLKYAECDDADTVECEELNDKLLERAKEILLNAIDLHIEHLNKLDAKIDESDYLTDEEVTKLKEDIAALIERLEELRQKVEDATSKDDIQNIVAELKDLAEKVRKRVAMYSGHIINARIGQTVVKSEILEEKLDCAIAGLEDQGVDVAAIDLLVADFSKKIQSSKDNYRFAKQYLDAAREQFDLGNDKAAKELVDLSNQRTRDAKDDLTDAHKLLTDILRMIRAAGGDISACTADSDVYQYDDPEDDIDEDEEESDDSSDDESDDDECVVDADCADGRMCVAGDCEDVDDDSDDSSDDESDDVNEVCCYSYGYGAQMVKSNENYKWTTVEDCTLPADYVGGGMEIVDDDICEDSDDDSSNGLDDECLVDADCDSDEMCVAGDCEDSDDDSDDDSNSTGA